jgi:hypothetical protein
MTQKPCYSVLRFGNVFKSFQEAETARDAVKAVLAKI